MAGNRRRRQRDRLIGFFANPACADGAAPSGIVLIWKGQHPGPPVPDVKEDVAQDRKRQEP